MEEGFVDSKNSKAEEGKLEGGAAVVRSSCSLIFGSVSGFDKEEEQN